MDVREINERDLIFLENFSLLKKYLEEFKNQILTEIRSIVNQSTGSPVKRWMKSKEVRELLDTSHGKLQTMRKSGIIAFTKIGGAVYYDREDIIKMFEKNKVNKIK